MTCSPHRHRKIQRLSLWSAAFAFLLQTLAWSAMPVAAAGTGTNDGWVVICTSDGFKRISLAEAGIQPDGPLHTIPG